MPSVKPPVEPGPPTPWPIAQMLWVVLIAAALALTACEGPSRIVAPLASEHAGYDSTRARSDDLGVTTVEQLPDLNELNPGVGLGWELGPRGLELEAGGFVNSYRDFAPYAGLSWRAFDAGGYRAGLALAAAYYRSGTEGELVPLGGPWIERRVTGPVWARLVLVPWLERGDGLVLVSLSVDLGE